MGVVHKLKPEINDFLLEQKRKNPTFGCRALAKAVENKFQIRVSKSSVNSLLKETGLSMPVGRRRKPKRNLIEASGLGAILLKCADYLAGGTYKIAEALKNKVAPETAGLLEKTEYLLYAPFFETPLNAQAFDQALWALINQRFAPLDIAHYLADFEKAGVSADMAGIISGVAQAVRSVKLELSDGQAVYLDGQLHTIWSTPELPRQFSLPLFHARRSLAEYLKGDSALILLLASGYDMPTKDFFNFLLSLSSPQKLISRAILCGSNLEELETIPLDNGKERFLVFGLWPWQFRECRKIKINPESQSFYLEALKADFSVAYAEVELSQPDIGKTVNLRGCALKASPAEDPRLFILTNLPMERAVPQDLASLYLAHWPNLEEGFQDFSRKIEAFTSNLSPQVVSPDKILVESLVDTQTLFRNYLYLLDLNVRNYFLPAEYLNLDFKVAKERFYDLKAVLKRKKAHSLLIFEPPAGYPFLKDLLYACRRLNQLEITFINGNKLWFSVAGVSFT